MLQRFIKNLPHDSFWRNNAIFLAGSLLVAFLNYLYYPVLGRLLDVRDFGEVQALLSILNLIGILLAAFQIVIINIAANNKKGGAETIQHFERAALLLMMGFFALITVFAGALQQFFNFNSFVPFIVLGVILVVSVLTAFRSAYIQGKSNFVGLSVGSGIAALGKLIFSALLVLLGLRTFGAIGGMLVAQLLALIYMARVANKMGFTSVNKEKFILPDVNVLKPELKYLVSVMAVFFTVTLLYTADILVVKRYFDPEIAGQYAGISAIAKIIFFATTSFAGVLLASVGKSYSSAHNKQVSRRSLALVATVGSVALLIFYLVPELIIRIMIGERYLAYAHLLPTLGLVVFLVSLVNLCFYYFLALRQYIIVPIAITGGLTTLLLTAVRHDTLEVVIQNFLVGNILILVLIASLSALYRVRFNRKSVA